MIEIVSEADMRSPEEAYAYLTALKEVIQYAGISDVKMEEGSMRVDANISLRPYGQEKFGTKTGVENLNSFSNVRKGLEYEVQRQAEIFAQVVKFAKKHVVTMKPTRQPSSCVSKKVLQTTATSQNQTYLSLKSQMSGLRKCVQNCQSFQKNAVRYVSDLGLSDYDASQLTATKSLLTLFEKLLPSVAMPNKSLTGFKVKLLSS